MEENVELINERRIYKTQNNIETQRNYKYIRKEANEYFLGDQCTIEEYLEVEVI